MAKVPSASLLACETCRKTALGLASSVNRPSGELLEQNMEIVYYPNPVLRRAARAIEKPDAELVAMSRKMLDLMYETEGVGLAAPQVGKSIQLLVLNPSGDAKQEDAELVLINPKITSKKGKAWGQEGCLSFPGIFGEVKRAIKIRVEAVDPSGEPIEFMAEDFLARVIQHEMDHLTGILFTDRFSPAEKIKVKGQLEELEERYRDSHGTS